MEKKQDEIEAAYHEAGHAVAGLALGHWFKDVRIRAKGGGRVLYHEEYWERIDRTSWEEEREILQRERLTIIYAGEVATAIHYDKPLEIPNDGAGSDWDKVGRLLLGHSADREGQDKHREAAIYEANALLGLHWEAVEAIAKALLERKRLSYKQVKAIYDAAG
jgi:ATP-dependent Zn protease